MEIKTYNKSQLAAFVKSPEFQHLANIPISPHRAFSYQQNPRADEADVLLVAAFEGNQLIGYQAVLPDYFYAGSKSWKVGWLSGLWIEPGNRGKGIAQKILDQVFECWHNRIFVTEFTPEAGKLFERTGHFHTLQVKEGLRLYNRFNLHQLLPPKCTAFQKSRLLWKGIDKLANFITDVRFPFSTPDVSHLKWEYVNHIDEELENFINQQSHQHPTLPHRGKAALDWILSHPWILSAPTKDHNANRYFFSAVEPLFEFVSLKIRDSEGRMKVFMVMARRNDQLKLPYCIFQEEGLDAVITMLRFHMVKWRVSMFTTFQEEVGKALSGKRSLALFKKPVYRTYLISRYFEEELQVPGKIRFQDGDGDCAFT